MRANKWSRILVVLGFFSLPVWASPPPEPAPEPGTRVTLRLNRTSAPLPKVDKMVEPLMLPEGKHQVQLKHRQSPEQVEFTLEVWGRTLPREDMAQKLRETFPVLASADIQVVALDPQDRPKPEDEGDLGEAPPGGEGQIKKKKVMKILQKEE